PLEHSSCNKRVVAAGERLSCSQDSDEAEVKRIIQNRRESVHADWTTSLISQPAHLHLLHQARKRVLLGRITLERLLHQRPIYRIDLLWLSLAHVEVADRGAPRVQPLFETPVHSLPRFVPKVADKVGCD